MLDAAQRKKIEELNLAPYAMKSGDSRGRQYPEDEHPYRSIYQRDRDRIIYSTAFRRLQYKTQVFVNYEGDHYRTRLTHTLEVTQIARTIATALQLNPDLTEAIAMAHDIGHTAFGHAGEITLHELMKDHGGFEHNRQGLRIVDLLEERYAAFQGLNLTWEVREGIIKHSTPYDQPNDLREFDPGTLPTLEAQVVNCADQIAYDNHDLDDGLRSGLIDGEAVLTIKLCRDVSDDIKKARPPIPLDIQRHQIIRRLIDLQINDLLQHSEKLIRESAAASCAAAKKLPQRLIGFSPQMQKQRTELQEFLMKNLYQHHKVMRMSEKAKRFLKELFQEYIASPRQLPPAVQKKFSGASNYRAICDYIAGMTDRYALDEYKKLFTPYERV